MEERKPISKRMRFEVFKRDEFTCQYCGSTPPSVVLEIDHINPVSKGGGNRRENLITACFDCNRGKSNILLSSLPDSISKKSELIAEKLAQVKAYDRLIRSKRKYENKQIDEIEEIFQIYFDTKCFTEMFKGSVRSFLQELSIDVVIDAMHRSGEKRLTAKDTIKYFCGICWAKIRELGDG